ncbi:MAG: M48 family metalloprotease [bacterium]
MKRDCTPKAYHWIITLFVGCFVLLPAYAEAPRTRIHQMEKRVLAEDIRAEVTFGRDVAARIVGSYGLYWHEDLIRYVNLIGRTLGNASNRPEIPYTIGILDTDTINAFSAPGGFIFVTRGVIETIDDEAQLAGIIAHEIIHVTQRHILKKLTIATPGFSPVCVFTQLVGGASDPARIACVQLVDETIGILFEKGYDAGDEAEADTLGAVLAASAGYDPTGLARYLETITRVPRDGLESYTRLYPAIEERIRSIEATIEKEGLSSGSRRYRLGRNRVIAYRR